MNIYSQIQQIAHQQKKLTEKSRNPLFYAAHYDLTIYDKDVLENDSQAGDTYLWMLKDSGIGTYMVRLADGTLSETIKEAGKNAKFYLLQCEGINQGVVKEITREQALNAHTQYKDKPNRVPRRQNLYDQINRLFGLNLWGSKLSSEFSPMEKDRSVMKVSKAGNDLVAIEILRTKIMPNENPGVYVEKPRETYYAHSTDHYTTLESLKDGSRFFLIEKQ